ncbi:MAG: hypothetical protein HC925_04375 [Coleofasciculaceae cyanobacterium SM2_3_26]|nr:hypothetical protein [Coleofasciculaceae cyanobacterium SM2_3_26]
MPSVDVSAEPLANPTVNLPGVNLSYRPIGGVNLFSNPTTEANAATLSPLQAALQEAATAAAPNPFLGISPTQSFRGQRFNPVQPDLNQPSLLAPLTVGQSAVLQRNGGTRSSLYGQPVPLSPREPLWSDRQSL